MILKNKAENPTHAIFGIATDGTIINAPISKFPHGLIAGATGSGKSVMINTILMSVMTIAHPDEVKFLIIDPKGNEFGNYKGLPFMLADPIIDLSQSKNALEYLANEMDYRMQLFQKHGGKKSIEAFNEAVEKGEIKGVDKLPYIILMIDELADLMSQYKDDVQGTIKRLGAKARAAGVHMLLSTQTPRREFIDGAIKANVPTKIVLMVASYTDSLVALGKPGAEELKPHGDFYASIGGGKIVRGQAPLIEDDEIAEIFEELREKYPAPELIDIDQAVVDAELRYKRMVAENTGKNPEDVTVENVGATTDSSKETIKSTRTEEEKEKAKKEHKEAMKKIAEDEKSGNTGAKEVSIDASAFSLKARNERRRKEGEAERKPQSGVIPASNSRRKKRQSAKQSNNENVSSTKYETETAKANVMNKTVQTSNKDKVSNTKKKALQSEKTSVQKRESHRVTNTKRDKPMNTIANRRRSTSVKKKPSNSTGSPLARKR